VLPRPIKENQKDESMMPTKILSMFLPSNHDENNSKNGKNIEIDSSKKPKQQGSPKEK